MRSICKCFCFCALFALNAFAFAGKCWADPFQLFQLNAQLDNGGTLTGTINLDVGSPFGSPPCYQTSPSCDPNLPPVDPGFQSTANVIYTHDGMSLPVIGINNEVGVASFVPGYPTDEVEFRFGDYTRDAGFRLGLVTRTASQGYGMPTYTGQVCVIGTGCYYTSVFFPPDSSIFGGFTDFTSATLTAVPNPTPEPSSFALLGSGLLCVAGAVKRRWRA